MASYDSWCFRRRRRWKRLLRFLLPIAARLFQRGVLEYRCCGADSFRRRRAAGDLVCRGEVLFRLLDREDLRRVRCDDLVFGIRCDDLDGDVLESGEEDTLSYIAFQQ